MVKPHFLMRYSSALVSAAGTAASLTGSLLSSTFWERLFWFIGSLLCGALTTWQCFYAARMADPARFVFEHQHWDFHPDDPQAHREMPFIRIPRSTHKRGRQPRVEFQQVDPIYGVPNFPLEVDSDGNITITRPMTSSMPPYPTFGVLIHYR